MARSSASVRARKRVGVSGSAATRSRSNAARADASETCCSRTMWSSVAKPGSRSHSGGGPWRATIPARSASRTASCSTAARRPSRVSGWSAIAPARLPGDRATLAKTPGRQRIERPTLCTAQPGSCVLAERRPVVAALLEDDQAPAESGGPPADLVVDIGRQREIADRVEPVRVETERDHDHRTWHGRDRLERPVRGGEVFLVGRARPQRDVEVFPGTLALTGLVGTAQEIRILAVWIGMDRDITHVAPPPEDLLGAVAVVVVDVED